MPPKMIEYTASLVGVQKAATTTLHGILREHPGFARRNPKEIHFFDDENVDWSDPDYSEYAKRAKRPRERVALDSTPSYIFIPNALRRMHDYRPEMKLIAAFRDPIDRAFSAWNMEFARRDSWPSFGQAVRDGELSTVPPESTWKRIGSAKWDLVARGLYAQQLSRGLEIYPREQWLLMTFEQIVKDPTTAVNEVAQFIGLRPFEPETADKPRWSSPGGLDADPVTAADIELLASSYVDELPAFVELTGFDISTWTTSRVLAGDLAPADVAERLNKKAGLVLRP